MTDSVWLTLSDPYMCRFFNCIRFVLPFSLIIFVPYLSELQFDYYCTRIDRLFTDFEDQTATRYCTKTVNSIL